MQADVPADDPGDREDGQAGVPADDPDGREDVPDQDGVPADGRDRGAQALLRMHPHLHCSRRHALRAGAATSLRDR